MRLFRHDDPIPTGIEHQNYTLTALFDDMIDAERSLTQLRRSRLDPEHVSVILRERVLSTDLKTPYRAVLSEVIEQSSLEAAGRWLKGLASLVLPDRATYLAAGPIGMILSTIRDAGRIVTNDDEEAIIVRHDPAHQLAQTMQAFGFDKDEALYIEQRVVLGSPLIAATADQVDYLRKIHEILVVNTPVYIGLVRTDSHVADRANDLVLRGPRSTGAVVIADAMSPLQNVTSARELQGTARDLRRTTVRSQYGELLGRVEDALYEPNPDGISDYSPHAGLTNSQMALRYVVVRMAGKLGMTRQRIAFPGDRVIISNGEIVLRISHEELEHAPRITGRPSLSRQEEASIRRHFQSAFYWIDEPSES